MDEREDVDKLERDQKLSRYQKTKQYYEILLLDMLRANEIDKQEYDRIIKDEEASYAQFLIDLKADNENVKYI